MTKERTIAGPAYCAAALPVSTKMPAPMIAPMPSIVRFVAESARLSVPDPVCAASVCSDAMLFVLDMLMRISPDSRCVRAYYGARLCSPPPQPLSRSSRRDVHQPVSPPGVRRGRAAQTSADSPRRRNRPGQRRSTVRSAGDAHKLVRGSELALRRGALPGHLRCPSRRAAANSQSPPTPSRRATMGQRTMITNTAATMETPLAVPTAAAENRPSDRVIVSATAAATRPAYEAVAKK